MDTPLERFIRGNICPYYVGPPGSDDDLELIAPLWTSCPYEGRCEDEGRCPILPPERRYPILKERR